MILLDVVSFPEVIQACMAVISACIAALVYFQGKQIDRQGSKIKDLVRIVEELKKQNETQEKRLRIETFAKLSSIIPILKWDHKAQNTPDKAIIYLYNIGCEAKQIITDESIDDPFIVFLHNRNSVTGGLIQIDISMKDGTPLENIKFNVCSSAISGIKCKQTIFKNPENDLQIGFPESEF
jgi:hypothetical protein